MWIWFLTYLNFHFWRIYESFPAIIHVTISPSQLLLFVITGLDLFCMQAHYFQCLFASNKLSEFNWKYVQTNVHNAWIHEYSPYSFMTSNSGLDHEWNMHILAKLIRVEVIDPFGAETVISQLDFRLSGLIDRLTARSREVSKPRDWG